MQADHNAVLCSLLSSLADASASFKWNWEIPYLGAEQPASLLHPQGPFTEQQLYAFNCAVSPLHDPLDNRWMPNSNDLLGCGRDLGKRLLNAFIVSLSDTTAALQARTHPSAAVLHALHNIRVAFISSITANQPFDDSAVEAKRYSLMLGLALVRARVLHTYARMLAEVRAHTDDRSNCSSPKHDAMILGEALRLTASLLSMTDCGDTVRGEPLIHAKARLRSELLFALVESELLEHVSVVLLRLARNLGQAMQREATGNSALAQGGGEAAQQQQDDGVPAVLAVVPGLDFWEVLAYLDRNHSTIFNLILRPGFYGSLAHAQRAQLRLRRLTALSEALLTGRCVQYLAAACTCRELAARYGCPDFGLPRDSLPAAANGDFSFWDSVLAALVWPSALDGQQLPYRAVDAFLMFERAAQQLCRRGALGAAAERQGAAALGAALKGLRRALDGTQPPQREGRARRAGRCVMEVLHSWIPGIGHGDDDYVVAATCSGVLRGFGSMDYADFTCSDPLSETCGPPEQEVAVALAEGLVPAVERIVRAAAAASGAGCLYRYTPLGACWHTVLAHARPQQVASATATLRKWVTLALGELGSPGFGAGSGEGPGLEATLSDLGTRHELLFVELLQAARVHKAGTQGGIAGDPEGPEPGQEATRDELWGSNVAATAAYAPHLPAQVPLLITFSLVQLLPAISRRCIEHMAQGRWEVLLGAASGLLHQALVWVGHAAEQCRLSRLAAAAAGPMQPATCTAGTTAAAMAGGSSVAASVPAVAEAVAPAIASSVSAAEVVPPAQVFASWRTLLLRDVRAFDLLALVLRDAAAHSLAVDCRALLRALDELAAALPEDARQHVMQGSLQPAPTAQQARLHAKASILTSSSGASAAAPAPGTGAALQGASVVLACGQGPVWLHHSSSLGTRLEIHCEEEPEHFHVLQQQLQQLLQALPEVPEDQAALMVACIRPPATQPGGQPEACWLPPPCVARGLLPTCANPLCANLAGPSEAALPLRDCARCARVSYCCRGCQLAHWPEHRHECAGRLVWG